MKPSAELYQEVWSIRLVTVEPRGGRDLSCHSRSSKESWTQLDCPLEVSYAQAPIWSSLNFQRPCGTQTTLTNMTVFLNRFLLFRLTKNLLSSQSVLQLKFHIKLDLICYLLTTITHTHTHTHTHTQRRNAFCLERLCPEDLNCFLSHVYRAQICICLICICRRDGQDSDP